MKTKFNSKLWIFATICLLFSSNSYAQDEVRPFQFGLLTSANFSWVKGTKDPIQPNGLGMGYSIGITGDFALSKTKKNYFFSVDFISTNIRSRIKLSNANTYTNVKDNVNVEYENIEHTYKINYIELPFSLKLKINEIGYTTWFAQFGVAPSIVYSTKAKWEGQRFDDKTNISTEFYANNDKDQGNQEFAQFRDDIRFYRIATFIGVGMEYRFTGNTAVVGSLRWNNGLSNVFADNRDPKGKGHNSFLALNVGVMF